MLEGKLCGIGPNDPESQTVLTANGDVLDEVDINQGIFQGDSLSPLLFIIVMIPLTILLKREYLGYKWGPSGKLINHLLFMDDIKLYGKSMRELESFVEVVSRTFAARKLIVRENKGN